jgi:hypothetical protein
MTWRPFVPVNPPSKEPSMSDLIQLLAKASKLSRGQTPEDTFKVRDEILKIVAPEDYMAVISICDSICISAFVTMKSIYQPADKHARGGMVYFIKRSDGKIKIGTSKDANKRLLQLQDAAGGELLLVKTIDGNTSMKSYLQRKFAISKHYGDWFNPSDELIALIENERALLEQNRSTT